MDIIDEDIQKVFNILDKAKKGIITFDEFLSGIKPSNSISNFRKTIVEQAFSKLDRNGLGTVALSDIKGLYSAKFHPDVKKGKKSEEQVCKEFFNDFEAYSFLSVNQ